MIRSQNHQILHHCLSDKQTIKRITMKQGKLTNFVRMAISDRKLSKLILGNLRQDKIRKR